MFRLLTALPAIALLVAALPASAAPWPDEKPGGPAVVGQAKSFNELLEMAKTLVKNVGGDAIYKEFEQNVLPELDPKQLPGIDPKRRFGIYGFINAKLEDCRGVLMIPVPSEKDFVDQLAAFHIEVAKGKEPGVSDIVTPPGFPIPVSFRVYKEYAYVSIGGSDVLADKVILYLRDVINDKEKAAGYLSIRFDRISPEAKKSMHAILREQVENLKEMIPDPDLKDAFHAAEKLAMRWLKTLFEEGKEIAIRIDADTKTGDVFADITVEAMPKSSLAEAFASRKPNINRFASLSGDDYVQRVYILTPRLFADEAKEESSKLIDFGMKELIKDVARGNTPPEVPALIDAISKSLKATVESGEMDLAAAIRGPNKDGFYNIVGALHCREGAQLEKAIREVVKVLPERERSYFKFDAGKIGDLSVHEIDMSTEAGEIIQKLFGKGQKAYFAFGKNALYASYGPDGMKMLKEAIEAKPGPAAAFDNNGNGKKTVELMEKIFPKNDPNVGLSLGWMTTMTGAMRVSVEGGDKLKIRVSNNVGMMMYFMLGRSSAAAGKPVAPPPPAK